MLLIGSVALEHYGLLPAGRVKKDLDYIATFKEMQDLAHVYRNEAREVYPLSEKKWVIKFRDGRIYEFEIAWQDSTAAELLDIVCAKEQVNLSIAPLNVLYALKLSHRYLKDSPHFKKTMDDILWLRKHGCVVPEYLKEWMVGREKETYNYKHPSLMRDKAAFFSGDGVNYVYDHDSLHEAVKLYNRPAYTRFQSDGAEVQADRTKFALLHREVQLASVYEEAAVLALERAVVPFNTPYDKAFIMALGKVCTSITSGWWREWAWEHYYDVIKLWHSYGKDFYIDCFSDGLANGIVKPHKVSHAA